MKRFPRPFPQSFRLAVVLLACLFVRSLQAQESILAATETSPAPALFSRIVLLGASLTAGFDQSQPFGGPKALQYRFAHFVEAALIGSHEPVSTEASNLLFLSAPETMEKQVTATVAAKPSLVIGLDALFWFCYGAKLSDEARLERFESGLRLLERIPAPLLLGDIPDAGHAVGGILGKDQVPELALIARCNERLKSWVAAHPNATLFPLSKLMATASANEELTLGHAKWAKGQSRTLLRSDRLHPSRRGLAALAIEALELAAAAVPPLQSSVLKDAQLVYQAALARSGVETSATAK